MKFEFLADAVEIPPERPTNPSVGYPSDGDARTGRAPTTLGAWFFYMLMVEFTTLLEQNGIEPDAENLHQLADFFGEYKSQLDGFKGSAEEFKVAAEAAATQAATKAAEAVNSASGASSSASQAANSASQADASKNAAKVSETNAKNSETAAASSASSAQVSANTASQKSVDASNSATSAENAKVGAEAARDEAKGYAASMGNPLGKDEAAQTYATKAEMASGLAGKAAVTHTHVIADVANLQTTLDTFLTKTSAASTYLGISAKAASAATADSATTATKLGTANVGGASKPIYLNAGTPTACSSNVGSTTVPVYMNAGTITSTGKTMIHTGGGQTINGNLTVTGTLKGGTVQSTSDIRMKDALEEIASPSLDGIYAYRYTLRADGIKHYGLIAQEVQRLYPEAVSKDDEGYLALDYNAIVAVLLAKVKELETRIKRLEA